MHPRTLCALLAALTLLALPGVASARPLKVGSHGPRVAQVQRWLGLHVDRIYGPATKRAVSQTKNAKSSAKATKTSATKATQATGTAVKDAASQVG